ncbi:hypothetical protein M3J09_010657 [Ascochyta lentis]
MYEWNPQSWLSRVFLPDFKDCPSQCFRHISIRAFSSIFLQQTSVEMSRNLDAYVISHFGHRANDMSISCYSEGIGQVDSFFSQFLRCHFGCRAR